MKKQSTDLISQELLEERHRGESSAAGRQAGKQAGEDRNKKCGTWGGGAWESTRNRANVLEKKKRREAGGRSHAPAYRTSVVPIIMKVKHIVNHHVLTSREVDVVIGGAKSNENQVW